MKTIIGLILSSLFCQVQLIVYKDFNIVIERQLISDHCIQGYLFVNSDPICYTLELPWKDNVMNESSIPNGTYNGVLRYDKSDGWRIELSDVPNRSGIQIHIGNYTSQIKGCTLVGDDIDVDNCMVLDSAKAYQKLKNIFYGSSNPKFTPNKNIKITYK